LVIYLKQMYEFVFKIDFVFILIPIHMDSCVTFYHLKELHRKKQ
jgi:hypothetical protein